MTITSVLSFTLATCSLAITSVLAQSPDSLPPNASRPKLLAIEFADDQINSPEFSALEREMPRVKNGRYVIVPADSTTNGEWTMMNTRVWRPPVQELLRSVTH